MEVDAENPTLCRREGVRVRVVIGVPPSHPGRKGGTGILRGARILRVAVPGILPGMRGGGMTEKMGFEE